MTLALSSSSEKKKEIPQRKYPGKNPSGYKKDQGNNWDAVSKMEGGQKSHTRLHSPHSSLNATDFLYYASYVYQKQELRDKYLFFSCIYFLRKMCVDT